MFLIVLSLVTIFLLWCLQIRFSRDGRLIAKIPGPKGLPILGNAFQYLGPPDEIFKLNRELYKKYKGVVQIHSLNYRCVNIYDPEDIAIILSSVQFHEKQIPYNFLKPWLSDGLLTSNGYKWHHRRKMLTPAFHLNILKKFLQVFVMNMEYLQKTVESEVLNGKTNLYPLISRVSLQIVCETSMGVSKQGSLELMFQKYFHAIEAYGDCIVKRACRIWYFLDWIYNYSKVGRKQKDIIQDLHAFSKGVIRDRRKFLVDNLINELNDSNGINRTKHRLAMIDLLFQNERDEKIDECGIREEVDTFLFAGYDTVTTTLMFFFMRIANEPIIQQKIHEEIENIFGNTNREPTIEDLNELKYTECCIKETLRMYPSVPYISRYTKKEVVLGGYEIPKKTHINIMIYDLHNREDIYPEPEKFIPERFLSINQMKIHPYAFIPFSAGPRNCIGQKYAMLEMKTLISGLFRKYRLEPVTRPEDIVMSTDLVLRSTQPIYTRFCKK